MGIVTFHIGQICDDQIFESLLFRICTGYYVFRFAELIKYRLKQILCSKRKLERVVCVLFMK